MRQKRFQKGSVRPRKHGKNKVWVAQWWEDGRKKSKVLGRCTMMGKSEAEAAIALISSHRTRMPAKRKSPSRPLVLTSNRCSCRCVSGIGRSPRE
jgi:hypothetical protein